MSSGPARSGRFEPEGAQLFIAYSRNRTASAKIQALTQHLRLTFGDPPYWEKPT
jgi:hypothetical protein